MAPTPKIIDLLKEKETPDNKPHVSLEFFPPRTEEGVKNLHARMTRMKETLDPLFTDMTWGAGGSTAELSLDLALYAHKTGHISNMHLTCTNLHLSSKEEEKSLSPKDMIGAALQKAYDGGIRNIVALRGDPPAGQETWTAVEGGFACALDLVEYMQQEFPNKFGIAVAGYPEGHPNAITEIQDAASLTEREKARSSSFDGKLYCCREEDYQKELAYLKKKIDAGADLIITQMFFDAKVFATFVKDCRDCGITCPIVPGLMCINTYAGFCKMTKFCKTRVPEDLAKQMETLKDASGDDVKAFGIEFGTQLCKELIAAKAPVLHFYTLNLEKVVYGILENLGYAANAQANEADAATMVARGSAWAREGDRVESLYGTGIVKEIRSDGSAVIQFDTWLLAEGQKPTAILQKDAYRKIFEERAEPATVQPGDKVESVYGTGIVQEVRPGGSAVIHFDKWALAMGQVPVAILQQGAFRKVAENGHSVQAGDKVQSIYGTGIVKEMRPDGSAAIQIESWLLAQQQSPTAILQKGAYRKISH